MKISVLCGGEKALAAAEVIRDAMYEIHGAEVRIFTADSADELYIQGADALLLAEIDESSALSDWLDRKEQSLILSGLLGAVLSENNPEELLERLGCMGADISADLICRVTDDNELLRKFGRNTAIKTAQLVGNWSLDFD